MGNVVCRTCFIDDALRRALDDNIDCLVILGAGLDSRAYRIPRVSEISAFELDQSTTLNWKKVRLSKIFGITPNHVRFVPVDFDQNDLEPALTEAGFVRGAKTFFILEGITQYISEKAVDGILRSINRLAGSGSPVVFTYIKRGAVDGTDCSDMDRKVSELQKRNGVPWTFGFEPNELNEYLRERGLSVVEDIGALEYKERYPKPLGRDMKAWEGERIVLAYVE